jgi:hypothetical protein
LIYCAFFPIPADFAYNGFMGLQCNINARGKRTRLINGLILLGLGILIGLFWAWPTHAIIAWIITGFVLFAGAFCIFEAKAGWCALRAIGMKTKI